ncbi:cell growth-regulating nucleolar protein [Anopheles marshallii]|uniref:cell growth-regulating nucleolar protein n=1 Tax=Anopheles marshallii TaxID=1521116 RepID=UPI00237B8A12|nr:cell growth-regulating nucleolar protein [Anopheles marshallii]
MVFFICNHCGESLKKQVVSNHGIRCNREINVSCMDCQKDFKGQAYDAHNVCISEAQKYSPKGYIQKVTKGVKKQGDWISKIRSIPEQHKGLSRGVMNVFEIIKRNDNTPRKMKPFMNFFCNSNRGISRNDVETAWNLIAQEIKNDQQTPTQTNGQEAEPDVPSTNGTSDPKNNGVMQKGTENEDAPIKQKKKKKTKQTFENDEVPVEKKQKKSKNAPETSPEAEQPQPTKQKKRKTKDAAENDHEEEEPLSSKQKKRKTTDSSQNGNENGKASPGNETNGTDIKAVEQEQNGSGEKFNLSEVIRALLTSQNNEMKLSKLKKKVMKRYQQATGEEVDGKFEKKFQKKIAKTGFVVENDSVRLVEA